MNPEVFDQILRAFTTVFQSNWSSLTAEALGLLGGLATIGLILMAVGWYAAGAGDGWFANAIFAVAQYTLLVVFVTNLQDIVEMFTNSFVAFGLMAGGGYETGITFGMPSTIFKLGLEIGTPFLFFIMNLTGYFSSIINLFNILLYGLFLLLIWVSFWLMALHILCAVIELQILTIISLLLIPWAAVGPTSFIAAGAFGRLISAVVYMGLLALVTGITVPVYTLLATQDNIPTFQTGAVVALGAVTLAVLNWKVPNMTGRNTFTAQGFAQAGAAVTYGITRALRMI